MSSNLPSVRTPTSNRSVGIEWEMFVNREKAEEVKYKHNGFFYCDSDGSIRPDWRTEDVEVVSQPLTVPWLLTELNRFVRKTGIQPQSNNSCGIHVHVSRKWLSKEKAEEIQKFYASLAGEEREFLFGRDSNGYCTAHDRGRARYRAVNVTNKNTVEFRMFSSGDLTWAKYCVLMAEYLVTNASRLNLEAACAARDCLFKEALAHCKGM